MNITAAFHQWRAYLFSVAYNITGQVQEAEDIVQSCFEDVLQAMPADIRNEKTYLARMVANKSIDRVNQLKKERAVYTGYWLPEPYITTEQQAAENTELLPYGLLHAMEMLNPVERAVLILREAFDFSYSELAEICNTSEENCRQLLHRAKTKVKKSRENAKPVSDKMKQLLQSFLDACTRENATDLSHLLKEDIVVYSDGGGKAQAALHTIHGQQTVVKFLLGLVRKTQPLALTVQWLWANGQPAALLLQDGRPDTLLTLEMEGEQIRSLFFVRNPDKIFLH
jgi:RNA polymerase sigma-70 factor (ECF subfamily)